MPTGYTAEVKDGTVADFRTFTLRCARAFGACIMQRDDPMADQPKHREVDAYYRNRVATAEAEQARLATMTLEAAERAARAEYDRKNADRNQALARMGEERHRYEAMLSQVEAWEPPTPEHSGLKEFMAKQLRESISYDCHSSYYATPPTLMTAASWLDLQRRQATEEVGRALKSLREEEQRCADANAWIDALYASLT